MKHPWVPHVKAFDWMEAMYEIDLGVPHAVLLVKSQGAEKILMTLESDWKSSLCIPFRRCAHVIVNYIPIRKDGALKQDEVGTNLRMTASFDGVHSVSLKCKGELNICYKMKMV